MNVVAKKVAVHKFSLTLTKEAASKEDFTYHALDGEEFEMVARTFHALGLRTTLIEKELTVIVHRDSA